MSGKKENTCNWSFFTVISCMSLYHRKNKILALFIFPIYKIIMLHLHSLMETLICMNGQLGGVNPDLMCPVDRLYPYHMTGAG
jgi:hypothetical protein